MKLAPAVAALFALAACQPAWIRTIDALSDRGDHAGATTAALSAHASGEPKAQEILLAVGGEALRDRLDRARQAEADGNLREALAHFDAYIDLSEKMRAAGVAGHEVDVGAERAAVSKKFAFELFGSGQVALEDGQFRDAIGLFEGAELVNAAATDADRWIPTALTGLGHAELEAGNPRDAIATWERSVSLGGGEEPKMWSAATHAALGRHALKAGACRAAERELTAATILPFDLDLGRDLDIARACAQREVIVRPFEDLVPGGIQGHNVKVLLADQLTHLLRARGSRNLSLLDPASSLAKGTYVGAGRRVEVRGHLTRAQVLAGGPTTRPAQAVGILKVPCGGTGDPVCDEEVKVAYTLREQKVEVALAGTVKVIDARTGEQLALRPVELNVAHVRREGVDPKVTDVRGYVVQAGLGPRATDRIVGVRGEARDHFLPQTALPDPARVLDEAVVRLASEAADAVLSAVDAEPPVADPAALVVLAPITRAEDLRFGEAPIREDQPEDLDLGPGLVSEPVGGK